MKCRRLTRRDWREKALPPNVHIPPRPLQSNVRVVVQTNALWSSYQSRTFDVVRHIDNAPARNDFLYGFTAHSPLNNARRVERRLGLKLVEGQKLRKTEEVSHRYHPHDFLVSAGGQRV